MISVGELMEELLDNLDERQTDADYLGCMTALRAPCCPPRYLKLPSGVSTHTQDYAALANVIPEGSK